MDSIETADDMWKKKHFYVKATKSVDGEIVKEISVCIRRKFISNEKNRIKNENKFKKTETVYISNWQ